MADDLDLKDERKEAQEEEVAEEEVKMNHRGQNFTLTRFS